jgi:ABC-type transport system involved in cytochrome bd biosynthesis fused ATPase/permease subunit
MRLTLPTLTENEARNALTLTGAWDQVRRTSDGKVEPLGVAMSSLSVGARQRVLLARALAQPVALTLLDEPDENLDRETRAILGEIVHKYGATWMFVIATHDETLLQSAGTLIELPLLNR